MDIVSRVDRENIERSMLSGDAVCADRTQGRLNTVQPDEIRTEFQRDRDKILHSKSFRRLSHKTQVFLAAEGDHFRTRLTHTLEVAQIARTISRALSLNEDLTEAIALGHDLGHTPFGHSGEAALRICLARYRGVDPDSSSGQTLFRHNEQSLRVVDVIEHDGVGLNLTAEVRDGIFCHTGSRRASTLEGRVVALADRIAYVNHDIDDAIRAGILCEDDLPFSTHDIIGSDHSSRIEALVLDAVRNSCEVGDIRLSDALWDAMDELRSFLFASVYESDCVIGETRKASHLISDLFDYFMEHVDSVPTEYRAISPDDDIRAVSDYIAGMTDRYAKNAYEALFVPQSIKVFGGF